MFDTQLLEATTMLVDSLSTSVPEDHRGGLVDTPARVAKMYKELLAGYEFTDGGEILKANFNDENDNDIQGYDQMVIVRDIEFWSLCEHHLCPFFGKAHIGYIPDKKIVGLSKLPRLTEVYARRLQVQERMTRQILNDIVKYIEPLGAMIVVEAYHTCCQMRGVRTPSASTVTSACYGVMFKNPIARIEYMSLIRKQN